jgi:hypothetical protein
LEITLRLPGRPNRYLEVVAPPPAGTILDLDGDLFVINSLTLVQRTTPHPGGGNQVRTSYVATIQEGSDPESHQ